jgi:transketolase
MDTFPELVRRARARLLQMHFESGVGHIGGNLSCLDALMVLFHKALRPEDAFILSKGHAAGALYATLWSVGRLTDDDLRQFHQDNTKLSGHPAPHHLPEIQFATGSLGHGLSLAAGLALGKRLKGEPGRVFCLLSDGEWQEGSNWEALIFAAHHRLPVTLIVDTNGLQGFGTTKEIASQESLAGKFCAFGLATEEIDGHDLPALERACSGDAPGPRAVIAHTCKGCGVSFMEHKMEWHYLPLSEEQYCQALQEACGPCETH